MIKKGLVCLLAGWAFVACSDNWDNHFEANASGAAGIPEENLMELIGRDESLSKFAEILKITGADAYLTSNQTYTVWAPNNDALAGIDMSDMDALNRLVSNHIARYSNPTSLTVGEAVYMLNGKTMAYQSEKNFNGVELLSSNRLAQNGVFHVIGEQIPYQFNLLEYISTHENYDSLYKYVMYFHEKRYDESQSTVYDSVFVDYNPMLDSRIYGIGQIYNEDSVYTMILPDNSAWEKAYQHISPYFRVYGYREDFNPADANPANYQKPGTAEYADSVMKIQTAQAILNGLTFRGRISAPSALDSVKTVTGNAVYETAPYFSGYSTENASNGLMYFANGNLNLDDTCTWNHTIIVEAENPDTRTESNVAGSYIRQLDSDEVVTGVSQSRYLEVEGSVRSDGGIVFNIPNVLAGKYDVYVDFVPPIVDGEMAAQKKCRVQFQMSYINPSTGKSKVDSFVKNNDWVIGGTEPEDEGNGEEGAGDGTEDGTVAEKTPAGVVTIKAYEGYQFNLGEFYDGMWYLQDGNTTPSAANIKLQVRTNVTNNELKTDFIRLFRVDRIRFVPVVE